MTVPRDRSGVATFIVSIVLVGLCVAGLSFVGLPVGIALALALSVVGAGLGAYRIIGPRVGGSAVVRFVASMLAGLLVVGVAIQAVPYGRAHDNPPVTQEPEWDTPGTRELAVRACFDCHSNEVHYPWYADIAPFSWAVQRHVEAGRRQVNFSEWDRPQREADESAETVREGSMPPSYYLLTHSEARLDDEETRLLASGLAATIGDEGHGRGGEDLYSDDEGASSAADD